MRFRADITTCEQASDTILSVCQCGPDGIEYEVIIQRAPPEFEQFDPCPGPKLSCDQLGLHLVPGPEGITFSGGAMTIVVSRPENIEVDISRLSLDEQNELKAVAKALFQ
ncbi:MAG: hypothetical protein ISS78_10655 [Phycisphaerae bacterium]|nr:hypothetical protein [Phycisphaerae bacterium]